MTIHHASGETVALSEWNIAQGNLALQFKNELEETLSPNAAIQLWIQGFAKQAREICDTHGVALETFTSIMHDFQLRIALHLKNLQYYEGEIAHQAISIDSVLSEVEITTQESSNASGFRNGVFVGALFPGVTTSAGHKEECFFPIYARITKQPPL